MPNKRILIVEDESIIGLDIASKLERNGYEIIGLAVDDVEVWDILAIQLPDLILMDISLKSSVDGIELTTEIHKIYSVPVVYLTSYSDSATIKRSMETSPYGYIIKPFTTQTLLTTINLSFIRVELERSLREKNELLQSILDSTLDGIAIVDENGKIIMSNSSFCRIIDKDSCGINTHINELISDFSADFLLHTMHTIKTRSDDKRLLVSSCPFNNGHIITITDITEIETFKTALDNAEKRFTTLFKKKLVPAVLVDSTNSRIYDTNDSFMTLYQFKEGISGKKISDYIGEEVLISIKESFGDDQSFELTRIEQKKADGTSFYADFRGNRLSIDNKDYFLIDVEDISEKINIENMEKELKLQMIHTNKMTALGTLVSGVAHELNNPNNFIMFNSSLLLDYLNDIFSLLDDVAEKDSELKIGNLGYQEAKCDILQLLNGSVKGSERIRDIVLDLKGFARQDSPISKESIRIDKTIHASVRILHHKINKSTDEFSVHIEENLPAILGNTQKLEQVFINLIVNSLEALTSKSQHVSVTCRTDGDYVVTEIKDGGTGIPQDVLQRITEPFFTTKQTTGGTGLGLSIAYSIIKDHNGLLNISSEIGMGTTVKISIPKAVVN